MTAAGPDADADGVSRRTVLRTAAGGAVIATGLGVAGCGSSAGNDGYDAGSAGNSVGDPADTAGTAAGGSTGATGSGSGAGDDGGTANVLAKTRQIPVGGGKVIKSGEQPVVITQPTKGDFVAFSAVCTHAGCTVKKISKGTIHCPCHGSEFSVEDGSVQGGPAPSPLAQVKIKVKGGSIVRA